MSIFSHKSIKYENTGWRMNPYFMLFVSETAAKEFRPLCRSKTCSILLNNLFSRDVFDLICLVRVSR